MTVRDRIREQPLPGEAEAAARSWPVVEAALAAQTPARRSRRPRRVALRLALVAAALCVGLVAALTPAGAEVGDWIGDRFADRGEPARPAFAGLPQGPSVLAISALRRLRRACRRVAPARLVLRRGLVTARIERGGS